MNQLGTCPTTCDDDCESDCHEEHAIPRKRDHEPADCPAHQSDPDRCRCGHRWADEDPIEPGRCDGPTDVGGADRCRCRDHTRP